MAQPIRPTVVAAGTLKGSEVVNRRGEPLGSLEDVILDLPNGRVAYAVVRLVRREGTLVAIPWTSLQFDAPNYHFYLDTSDSHLDTAPAFTADQWPDFMDSKWNQAMEAHYRAISSWGRA